jgi:hypothetical protein
MSKFLFFAPGLAAVLLLFGDAAVAAGSSATPDYKVGERLAPGKDAAPSRPAKSSSSDFKLTNWDQLLPKGWNPMQELQSLSLSMMSDADPRAQEALERMKREWENAPLENSMDNQRIRIAGFVVPLEAEGNRLREFLLVPYFGACIHVPPPPANQIIHVKTAKPVRGVRAMDPVWISGTLRAAPIGTKMGTSGYRMEAEVVEPYKGP